MLASFKNFGDCMQRDALKSIIENILLAADQPVHFQAKNYTGFYKPFAPVLNLNSPVEFAMDLWESSRLSRRPLSGDNSEVFSSKGKNRFVIEPIKISSCYFAYPG